MNIISKILYLFPFYKRKENVNKQLLIPAALALSCISPKPLPFKNIFNYFYKSFYMFAFKPFTIGDRIKIGQQEGLVQSIDVNYVVINKKDRLCFVPTQSIYNNVVEVFKK
ncbi:hypothetical protein DMUE_4639 [Dictyocoela muelleri]|nr:hypothetical protein DMUE_4639 [Dictyocoela muelleri]